jgi:uncharacterized membrane protein YcjF (UPF0283 family)
VSETKIRPRLEFEEQAAPRLEALPVVPPLAPPGPGVGTTTLVAGGAAVLVIGMAALEAANFVAAQFDRGIFLGSVTLAVAVGGFGLIAAGFFRELRGLISLRHVDHLRRDLADPARTRAAALRWVAGLPDGAALRPALAATDDPDAIAALLRAGPLASLRARSDALGWTAARQVFGIAAAVPSPAFDGLVVGWRGVRLVREIAALHGVRPGVLGTLALLRRTAFAAASVMATNLAVDSLTRAVLSNPLLEHIAGDVAGAGVAARRMIVLARATAVACAPLDGGG